MLGVGDINKRLDRLEADMSAMRGGIEQIVELLTLLVEIENIQLTRTNKSAMLLEKQE